MNASTASRLREHDPGNREDARLPGHRGRDMEYLRAVVAMRGTRCERHSVLAVKLDAKMDALDNVGLEIADHRRVGCHHPLFSIAAHA